MWNHVNVNKNNAKREDGPDVIIDKVQKHLDLSAYLNFLQSLFSRSTSDSEDSDSDTLRQTNISSDVSQNVPGSNFKLCSNSTKTSSGSKNSQHSGRSLDANRAFKVEASGSQIGSTSTSHFSAEDGSSVLPDLAPLSDLELNSLLKKTACVASDAESLSLDVEEGAANSDTKRQNKKKKKKPKKKPEPDTINRQNRPNSGGKGNGSRGFMGGSSGGSDSTGNGNSDSTNNRNSGGGAGNSFVKDNPSRKQSIDSIELLEASSNPDPDSISPSEEFAVHENSDFRDHVLDSVLSTFAPPLEDDCGTENDYICSQKGQKWKCAESSSTPKKCTQSDISETASSPSAKIKTKPSMSNVTKRSSSSKKSTSTNKTSKSKGKKEVSKSRKKVTSNDDKSSKMKITDAQIEFFNQQRRSIYTMLCRKCIPKTQKANVATQKEKLFVRKRIAVQCSRAVRQREMESDKLTKEVVWKTKCLSRELMAYKKQADKIEKEIQKKMNKEAEEERKRKEESMEAEKQKLEINRFIMKAELYSFKMLQNLSSQSDLLSLPTEEQLYGNDNMIDKSVVDYDDLERSWIKYSEAQSKNQLGSETQSSLPENSETKQPALFCGHLKKFQIQGLSWLSKLFSKGCNCILADDTGLGKTVQTLAFLSYLAENKNIWGPFLVVTMGSMAVLNNWQHELKKYIPSFKVIPYLGSPQERKILRQFWKEDNLNSPEASFHVVITTCSVVVQDLKYFNRLKWQHIVFDEALTAGSIIGNHKWKYLLSVNSRHRLLLTSKISFSTNKHVWPLIHFLMSSLFESKHGIFDQFNNNLSLQDELKYSLDTEQLLRLENLVTPFILQRRQTEVQNELSGKTEVVVWCSLSKTQTMLYNDLQMEGESSKILTDISQKPENGVLESSKYKNAISHLLKLRKVCTHPSLIQRKEPHTSYTMDNINCNFQDKLHSRVLQITSSSPQMDLLKALSIFHPESIYRSQIKRSIKRGSFTVQDVNVSTWSFLSFIGTSPGELWSLYSKGFFRLNELVRSRTLSIRRYRHFWKKSWKPEALPLDIHISPVELISDRKDSCLPNLVFLSYINNFYGFENPDVFVGADGSEFPGANEFQTVMTPSFNDNVDLKPLHIPKFMFNLCPKVFASDWPNVSAKTFNNLVEVIDDELKETIFYGNTCENLLQNSLGFSGLLNSGISWTNPICFPDYDGVIYDSGKMKTVDSILRRCRRDGHKVVIFSHMIKMLDILEEYVFFRRYNYVRLDGSTKFSQRDMFLELQSRTDIFVYIMSSTKSEVDWNLIVADNVIFFDIDLNSLNEQAVQQVQRLSQNTHITLYWLVSSGTLEEKIYYSQNEWKNQDADASKKLYSRIYKLLCFLKDEKLNKDLGKLEPSYLKSLSEEIPSMNGSHLAGHPKSKISLDDAPILQNGDFSENLDSYYSFSPYGSDFEFDGKICNLTEGQAYDGNDCGLLESNSTTIPYFEGYACDIDWDSDYDDEFDYVPKKPRIGRGSGKRGRPPSRVRVPIRDLNNGDLSIRRGPGRPRIKPVGPANQGIRGRRPGRPPLSRKVESVASSLTPLTPSQHVFGIYSSPDLNIS